MADILYYKTVVGTEGNYIIHPGLNLAQIIKVSRQGEQKDYKSLLSGLPNGSQWTFITPTKRIVFDPTIPFAAGGETIHIIYKL